MTSDDEPPHIPEIRKQHEEDHRDYNDEIADRNTSRIKRFYSASDKSHHSTKAKEKEFLSALERLLRNNPEYARLYKAVNTLLTEAEIETEEALTKAQSTFELEQGNLKNLRNSASLTATGIAVFRDHRGQKMSNKSMHWKLKALSGKRVHQVTKNF